MGVGGCPLPSFPRKRESGGGWAAKGRSFQYRGDSRLRGNDGGKAAALYRRDSRVSGNDGGEPPPLYRRDSPLRGNDGGETAAPLPWGFPLTRE